MRRKKMGKIKIVLNENLNIKLAVAFLMLSMMQVYAVDKQNFPLFDPAEGKKIMESISIPVKKDFWTRPESKNGIIYKNGHPEFILSIQLGRNASHYYNLPKQKIDAPGWTRNNLFYSRNIDRNLADRLGLDAIVYNVERGLICADAFSELGSQLSEQLRKFYGVYLNNGVKFIPANKLRERNSLIGQKLIPSLNGLPIITEMTYGHDPGDKHMKYSKYAGLPDEASCHFNEKAVGWEFPFSSSNPVGCKITENYIKTASRYTLALGGNPWIYMFARETHAYMDMSPQNRQEFKEYLETKYKNINKLNEEWGLSGKAAYKDFAQIADSRIVFDENKRGLWIEWRRFGGRKFRETIEGLKRAVRKVDQRPNTYLSFMNAIWSAKNDYETVIDMSEAIKASDMYFTEGGAIFGDYPDLKDRAVDNLTGILWANRFYAAQLFTDQGRALSPDKPIFNIEFYNYRWSDGEAIAVRSEDVITNLWNEVIHGGTGANMFAWLRVSPTYEKAMHESIFHEYELLNPFHFPLETLQAPEKFKKEIEMVNSILLPRPRIKGKVALLWSYASKWNRISANNATGTESFFDCLMSNYLALIFTNCPFDIIYEHQLQEGKGDKYQAIIVPGTPFMFKETPAALRRYLKNGGQLVVFGSGMKFDEYGKELPCKDILGVSRASSSVKANDFIEFGKKHFYAPNIAAKSFTGFKPETAKVVASRTGNREPVIAVNKFGKGQVFYIGAETYPVISLYELYGRLLPWLGIEQPYMLVDMKTKTPRPNIEMQIIDRVDKRLIYVVNWDNFKPHFMSLLDKNPIKGGAYVYDLVGRRHISSPDDHLKWTEEQLRSGIPCPLPGQTRHVLILSAEPFGCPQWTVNQEGLCAEYANMIIRDARQAEDCKRMAKKVKSLKGSKGERLTLKRKRARKPFLVDPHNCFHVDLRNVAHMAFADPVADDKTGGFMDCGPTSDLSGLPLGHQIFLGVPFEIIDPTKNNSKSCLVLAGEKKPYFPSRAMNISVNSPAKKLFFLHTNGWNRQGHPSLIYTINYADGSSQRLVMHDSREIGDWYKVEDGKVSDAAIAWEKCQESLRKIFVGIFAHEWKNPKPDVEIKTIDIKSSGNSVPTVIAITGEKP
jgi:beta-galactosidase GanA